MITVRNAAPHDREELVRIVRQQKNFNAQEIDVAIEVIDGALDPAKNDYIILVSEAGAVKLAGFIAFGPIPLTENRYDLYWVATDSSHGRKGIATRLLQGMEEMIRAQGTSHIYVDTSSTPDYLPARNFYEKNGYRITCVLPNFYRDGDDRVLYMKEI